MLYASFVSLAQAQRHRTLKYYMRLNSNNKQFYVPEMIRDTDLAKEWINDLTSIVHLYPQAELVFVIETGILPNFILKCEERLCGRAQLETMRQTLLTSQYFLSQYDEVNAMTKKYLDILKNTTSTCGVNTKCVLLGECKEPCFWGMQNALTRMV